MKKAVVRNEWVFGMQQMEHCAKASGPEKYKSPKEGRNEGNDFMQTLEGKLQPACGSAQCLDVRGLSQRAASARPLCLLPNAAQPPRTTRTSRLAPILPRHVLIRECPGRHGGVPGLGPDWGVRVQGSLFHSWLVK